jgi:hypothetical protein
MSDSIYSGDSSDSGVSLTDINSRMMPYFQSLNSIHRIKYEIEVYTQFEIERQAELVILANEHYRDFYNHRAFYRDGFTLREYIEALIYDDDQILVIKYTISKLKCLLSAFPNPAIINLEDQFESVSSPRRSKRIPKQKEFYYGY